MTFNHEASVTMPRTLGNPTNETATFDRHRNTNDGHSIAIGSTANSSVNAKKLISTVAEKKEFKLQDLAMLSISPIVRSIHNWWLQRAERHYLICADVEQQRAKEAQLNVAYYQKRAALARSARH